MEGIAGRSERVRKSLLAATSSPFRIFSFLFLSILTFLLLAFSTDIGWHLQSLKAGAWSDTLFNSLAGVQQGGTFSLLLSLLYSLASGAALTNVGVMIGNGRISKKGIGGVIPGFAATGCASCGVGIAGFLGFTGFASALPFNGDLFKIAGILILVYALHEMGDPEICRI